MAKATSKNSAQATKAPGSAYTAKKFVERLHEMQSPIERQKLRRFFVFDDVYKGKGDAMIGVRMGSVFALAKEFITMPVGEIERLLESPYHEARAGACSIMAKQATHKNASEQQRKQLYDLYLRRHDRINAWDLVDLASYKVIGSYLYDYDKPRKILYQLARSKDTWERRTAILATMHFILKGKETADAYKIAALLVKDKEDLVHKATGWTLRTAGGKKGTPELFQFLDQYASTMPRVALRYSIEHLDKKLRDHYLQLGKNKNA